MDHSSIIIKLIEKASILNNAIMPCKKDWKKSYTVEKDKICLWFNVPLNKGFTTKMITEKILQGD